jgi:hypothetical protein
VDHLLQFALDWFNIESVECSVSPFSSLPCCFILCACVSIELIQIIAAKPRVDQGAAERFVRHALNIQKSKSTESASIDPSHPDQGFIFD